MVLHGPGKAGQKWFSGSIPDPGVFDLTILEFYYKSKTHAGRN